LDCEQKLLDIAQSDDLKSRRQQSVKDFLSIRECMIQHFGSSSRGEDDIPTSVSKTDRQSAQSITTNRCDKVVEYPTLPEVVESFDEFRYDSSELGPILSVPSSEVSHTRDS
jgi:hypothetical protein